MTNNRLLFAFWNSLLPKFTSSFTKPLRRKHDMLKPCEPQSTYREQSLYVWSIMVRTLVYIMLHGSNNHHVVVVMCPIDQICIVEGQTGVPYFFFQKGRVLYFCGDNFSLNFLWRDLT